MHEDIHLVADQIDKTKEFVRDKVQQLKQVLNNISKQKVQRDAWDKAVFLRPFLSVDHEHYLTFFSNFMR